MLVSNDILEDLYNSAGIERKERALEYKTKGAI